MSKQFSDSGKLTLARIIVIFTRGLTLRCPNCGAGSLFTSWFRTRERCRRCSMPLERKAEQDDDYFLGAMMFNLVVAELIFAAGMLVWLLVTWPDVPWDLLQYVGVAFMIIAPVLFYPLSKTIWLAFDLLFRPLTHEERARMSTDAPRPGRG